MQLALDFDAPRPLTVGDRVRVDFGGRRMATGGGDHQGRTGRVQKCPRIIADHVYVHLDPTPREKTEKVIMFARKFLQRLP